MALEWSKWNRVPTYAEFLTETSPDFDTLQGDKDRQLTPYVHWSALGPGEDDIGPPREDMDDLSALVLRKVDRDRRAKDPTKRPWFKDFKSLEDPLPIPRHASPLCKMSAHKLPKTKNLPVVVDPETLIAGVIDVGMPLGHRSTRDEDGKTRVLAAWQMLGEYTGDGSKVPFGRELLKRDIDALLKKHSGDSFTGHLDEAAFNRATDGVTMKFPGGQSDLARQAAHGAHVLDAAVGDDPNAPTAIGKKTAIIAVNAPSAVTFGAGGTYLEQFLFHSIARIVLLSDAIWKKSFGSKCQKIKGFEIVINLAFGRQAAAQENFDSFRKALTTLNAARREKGWRPAHIVMPAGNDNLAQSNAYLEPKPGATLSLDWHVPPQDQSSNFVEVWLDDHASADPLLTADLSGPSGEAEMKPLKSKRNKWYFSELREENKLIARVYVERAKANKCGRTLPSGADNRARKKLRYRLSFVFCIAPTHRPIPSSYNSGGKEMPKLPGAAGTWTLSVTNRSYARRSARLLVQTDQGLTPSRTINRRSFFEEGGYRRFDDMGRPLDSYSYPPDALNRVVNQDIETKTPIRRHGTMLSMASFDQVARVGGYRNSDGRPAFYSAAGRGRWDGSDDGTDLGSVYVKGIRRAPTASFPTEDCPALFGILGAGSIDGSVSALRGTSFATSQATRALLLDIIKKPSGRRRPSAASRLFDIAQHAERTRRKRRKDGIATPPKDGHHPLYKPAADQLIEVIGGGRAFSPPIGIEPPRRPKVERRK